MKKQILFLISICTIIYGDKSSDICSNLCICKKENSTNQTLTIDCSNKNLDHADNIWPVDNIEIIKISFSGNNLKVLNQLQSTNLSLEINFSKCKIQKIMPNFLKQTKNIKFLDLSYNEIQAEEIVGDRFRGNCTQKECEDLALESLDLSYNQIHSLQKDVFEHLPNLKFLNLEGNDFQVLDVHTQLAISSARKLQSLNLGNNELTEFIIFAIHAHSNLTELNLSQNLLDFVPKSLSEIGKSLQILNIDSNPIIEFVSETFLGLENIRELSANNLTKLKYINSDTFAPMINLKKLSLSDNPRLKDIDREAFGVNQTLQEFYLKNNDLYKIDYHLLPWSELEVFDFTENPLECNCDLYNITIELKKDITRQEDGPYCLDPRSDRFVKVFNLKRDICLYKSKAASSREIIQYHFSLVRISLIILSVIVMAAALTAVIVGFVRYRRYRREQSYGFTSHIAYNPVLTNGRF